MKHSEVNHFEDRGTSLFHRVAERPIYRFSRWMTLVSALALIIIMVVTSADVLMRRFLNKPITGSLEISTSLLIVVIFCCVAWVMTEKGHIIVDIFSDRYPKKVREVITSIALFLSMITVGLICWGSINFGLQQYRIGEVTVLIGLPVAPFIFVLAFGSGLFGLVILIQFINTFIRSKED